MRKLKTPDAYRMRVEEEWGERDLLGSPSVVKGAGCRGGRGAPAHLGPWGEPGGYHGIFSAAPPRGKPWNLEN